MFPQNSPLSNNHHVSLVLPIEPQENMPLVHFAGRMMSAIFGMAYGTTGVMELGPDEDHLDTVPVTYIHSDPPELTELALTRLYTLADFVANELVDRTAPVSLLIDGDALLF